MRAFFRICEACGVEAGAVEARLKAWFLAASLDENGQKALLRAVRKGTRTASYQLLERFVREELGHPLKEGSLNLTGAVPDYFGRFGEQVEQFSARLDKCEGRYVVVRAGYDEIEQGQEPTWEQTYVLEIKGLDSTGEFVFTYADAGNNEKTTNCYRLEGYAFSTSDSFYLPALDPEGKAGIALFILQEHPSFGFDLLVGMQLAKLEDEDSQLGAGSLRELCVGRRIAAFRGSHLATAERLEEEARNWVRQRPMGAVVTLNNRLPRPKHR
jgi:hypothetical protein